MRLSYLIFIFFIDKKSSSSKTFSQQKRHRRTARINSIRRAPVTASLSSGHFHRRHSPHRPSRRHRPHQPAPVHLSSCQSHYSHLPNRRRCPFPTLLLREDHTETAKKHAHSVSPRSAQLLRRPAASDRSHSLQLPAWRGHVLCAYLK